MEKKSGLTIVCPYCGYEYNNSFEYISGEVECEFCKERFKVEVETNTVYHSAPIECPKKGESHDWKTIIKMGKVKYIECKKCLLNATIKK